VGTSQSVLVVEGEVTLRRQLKGGLAQRGYEVEECEEGLDALARIQGARAATPFHFVILNIRLPDIDGLKLFQAIQSTYPELPVLVISDAGVEDPTDAARERRRGVHLDRPFDIDALVAELAKIGKPDEAKPMHPVEAPSSATPLESALVFLRGRAKADLFDMYSAFSLAEGVSWCDPLVGEWDLALLFQAPNRPRLDALIAQHAAARKDVDLREVHYAEKPPIPAKVEGFIRDYERMQAQKRGGDQMEKGQPGMLRAYAVLDVDPSRVSALYMKFTFTDSVVRCDVTDDGRKMILLLQTRLAQDIQATLRHAIRPMPGVLRIRLLKALNFLTT